MWLRTTRVVNATLILLSARRLIVGETSVTVVQDPCPAEFTPAEQIVPGVGGTEYSVEVTAACNWSASPDVEWITITCVSSGSGNGTIVYDVAANDVTTTRTGRIWIGNDSHLVIQKPCPASLNPESRIVPGVGATSQEVSVSTECTWSASTDVDWITLTTDSGIVNGTLVYDVSPSGVTTERTGHVLVGNAIHTVQ